MTDNVVSIIGAGIAGLSAGCYLQMNGYQTKIFEMHDRPGGLASSWKRNGYLIQGGFPGLAGSSAGSPFYALWCELIEMSGVHFLYQPTEDVFEFPDGKRFHVYSNLDRLEAYMNKISPQDSAIAAFVYQWCEVFSKRLNAHRQTKGALRHKGLY
ncbi:MAG: hypothetical protein CMN78_03740 [Spirochaetales bacterium]|nr:hypothetical protein [Spirochaetales bacterium]